LKNAELTSTGRRERFHRVAVRDDVTDIVVIVFHMGFLAGLHRVAVEDIQPGVSLAVQLEKAHFFKFGASVC